MRATFILLLCGCGGIEQPSAPQVIWTSLDERSERVSPTAAIEVELSREVDTVPDGALIVVRGLPEEELIADACNPPISVEHLDRLAAGHVEVLGRRLRFLPARPLEPGALHTLVATTAIRSGGLRLTQPETRPFTTGAADTGAPQIELIAPHDGAVGVVRNLRAVEVRFSRVVDGVGRGSLVLEEDGEAVPAKVVAGGCPTCFQILPSEPLRAGAACRVRALEPIVDEEGTPVFDSPAPPGFTVGDELRTEPPHIDGLISSTSSGCLVARWATRVPASGRLCVESDCVVSAAMTLTHELARPLAAGGAAACVVSSWDESTAPTSVAGPFPAPASSPRQLTITEVLTRPLGTWPTQQFVEVWNRGAIVERLGGLSLLDEGGADPLPDVAIPPNGHGLIVPSGYREKGEPDPSPATGTIIVRIAKTRLGRDGLRTTGEAIALAESGGRLVSRFSTHDLRLARGQSAHRVAPCDVREAYAPTPGETSTPGRP